MFGYIYILSHKDNVYIGSTIDIFRRLYEHNYEYKVNTKNKFYNYVRSTNGFDEWDFDLLEQSEFESVAELRKKEYYYIKEFKPNLNTIKSKRQGYFNMVLRFK